MMWCHWLAAHWWVWHHVVTYCRANPHNALEVPCPS